MLLFTPNPNSVTDQPRQTGKVVVAKATAYCLTGRTASGARTHEINRCIALSRNLAQTLDVEYGDKVHVEGMGKFTYADRMPPQHRFGRPKADVDIWMPTRRKCLKFGRKQIRISKVIE